MDQLAQNEGARWGIAATCALLAGASILMLFQAPKTVDFPVNSPAMPMVLLRAGEGSDAAFDERKILADPTPLFLPTPWNAAQKGVPRPEPGAGFGNFSERLRAAESQTALKLNLPSPITVPATPAEALFEGTPGALMSGFGRSATALPVLAPRGAFVEIVAEGNGRVILRQALADANPPGESAWEPLEFLIAVDAAGLVGAVSITRRSGAEGVDDYFQRYLAQTLRVGQRLAPGFYRISVGP